MFRTHQLPTLPEERKRLFQPKPEPYAHRAGFRERQPGGESVPGQARATARAQGRRCRQAGIFPVPPSGQSRARTRGMPHAEVHLAGSRPKTHYTTIGSGWTILISIIIERDNTANFIHRRQAWVTGHCRRWGNCGMVRAKVRETSCSHRTWQAGSKSLGPFAEVVLILSAFRRD